MRFFYSLFLITVFLSSCGGGGSSSPPTPTVTISSSAAEIEVGRNVTLNWSSTNATNCSASGAWSGSKAISGSEEVTVGSGGSNNFSLTCSGTSNVSGSSSVNVIGYRNFIGKVIDGYVRGASVFIDENNNSVLDGNEVSTTSDNSGSFELQYRNGTLISLGGFDLDSANLLDELALSHYLQGYTDSKVITPVTSLIQIMNDADDLKSALGIDSSIDIGLFDPVANRGDGGIVDHLHEKGNQLAVLSLALMNINNDQNNASENTFNSFESIGEELKKAFDETQAAVNIETEEFIESVINNYISKKNLTLSADNKSSTIQVLSKVLPVIQVKSNSIATNGILNFATSTLQEDIVNTSNGKIDSTRLAQYQNDVLGLMSSELNLAVEDLKAQLSALADSLTIDEDTSGRINLLANDSFDPSSNVSVQIISINNGSASVSGGDLLFSPDENFNGVADLTYRISQANQSSEASVSIIVNPINDSPVLMAAESVNVSEGIRGVLNVQGFDVDGDDLTYSVSGIDAGSFSIAASGALSFLNNTSLASPNDSDNNNIYLVTVTVSDGTLTTSKDFSITIVERNNPPIFTSLPSLLKVDEGKLNVYQVRVIDEEKNDLSFSLSGPDAEQFNISNGGLLSFKSTKDFESSAAKKFVVTIRVTDGQTMVQRSVIIQINNILENNFGETKLGISKIN